MIKCETIKEFTLERFDELKNIQRRRIDTKGKLYVGDTFECTKEMVDYLMGNNLKGDVVVKIIEIEPEKIELEVSFDKEQAIDKVNEIAENGGTYEEAVKEVEKIIDETIKIKPYKAKVVDADKVEVKQIKPKKKKSSKK